MMLQTTKVDSKQAGRVHCFGLQMERLIDCISDSILL
jgi:hypothetical protein